MKIKRLFIIRHGETDQHGFLTEEGKINIERFADTLAVQYKLDPAVTTAICSRQLRALKTAQCIMITLGFKDDHDMSYRELFSTDGMCDAVPALRIVNHYAKGFENLFVVTHKEMAEELPLLFWKQLLEQKKVGPREMHFMSRHYGQGYGFDCESPKCYLIG